MSDYRREDYFAFYVKVLCVGVPVPFDCYIVLHLAQRAILFLSRDSVVTEEKLKRLAKNQHPKLYLRIEDKNTYFRYLDDFLQNPENKAVLQEAMKNGHIDGLPSEGEYTLQSLQEKPVTQNSDLGKTKIVGPLTSPLGEVVDLIKNQAKILADEIEIRASLSEDEKKVIQDVTLHLTDEIQKLEDALGQENYAKTIRSVTEHISEDLMRISQLQSLKGENAQIIKSAVSALKLEMHELEKEQSPADAKLKIQRVLGHVQIFRNIAESEQENLVTHALESMISSAESTLGKQLSLSLNSNNESQDAGWLVQRLRELKAKVEAKELDWDGVIEALADIIERVRVAVSVAEGKIDPSLIKEEHLRDTRLADPVLMEDLKNQMILQKAIIDELTETLKNTRPEFEAFKNQWLSFQMLTKRKLDAGDQMQARGLTQSIQAFEHRFFRDLNTGRKKIKKSSQTLAQILGQDKAPEIDSDEQDPDDSAIIGMIAENLTEDGEESGAPQPVSALAQMDQLVSENKVLQVQLENAQALVETTGHKTAELEEMIRSTGEYATKLEIELEELKKSHEKALEEIQTNESEKRRLSEGLEDSQRNLFKLKNEDDSLSEKTALAENRVQVLEKAVAFYREKFGETADITPEVERQFPKEARMMLMQKESQLADCHLTLKRKTEEIAHLNKRLRDIAGEDRQFEVERKELGKRLEKMRIEAELARQHEKALEIKITSTTNLLLHARKTIDKLTAEGEELRADRAKYIVKTNDALAEHKSLINQALALNGQLQQEMQKNRALLDQVETLKGREKDTTNALRALQTQMNQMETEKKKLEQELRMSSSGTYRDEAEALRARVSELERKNDKLKHDLREAQSKFAQEQNKSRELKKVRRQA